MFPTLQKGEGEATFHEGREENLHLGKKVGNFHVSQELLSIIVGEDVQNLLKRRLHFVTMMTKARCTLVNGKTHILARVNKNVIFFIFYFIIFFFYR